jgi:beta-lactam-binding protein with PASTA domain
VSVVVSLGVKPASDVEVPDVMTYSRDEAEATMKSAGLAVNFVGDSDGNVVGQDIAAGTKVAPGTTVTLTLQDPDPGQNPMMNFIGKYGCDRATAQVDAVGEDGGRVTVEWPSSAAETSEWVMEGTFNADTMKLKYKDGTKTEITFDSKGKETRKTVYTDGTGTITFNDDGTLSFTWKDDKEGVAKGMTFTYV